MNAIDPNLESKYARCVRASKAVRWDIEKDVIKGRSLEISRKFMPDGLTLVQEATFLSDAEKRFAAFDRTPNWFHKLALPKRSDRIAKSTYAG